MPELPEVEAARRAIEENCVGKMIKKAVIADDPKVIDGASPSDFEALLVGKTIVSAHRKGKHMWLRLDSPPFPTFHFGMAGAIYIKGVAVTKYKRSIVNDNGEWPSKYSKFFVGLDDGLELSFTDKRRFAKVCLLKDPASMPPISKLGPDALLEPMTLDEFIESLSKKKLAIKTLLLDQSYISGIGNWVADEVLYQARIHPQQSAATLSKESCTTLHKCIKEVLERAVEVGAESNNFPEEWLFHFRWGKRPGQVNGKEIHFITTGGRTSAFVPELQQLVGAERKNQNLKRKMDDGKALNDEGIGQLASKTEETAETPDTKKEPKPKGRSKKPSMKRKSKNVKDDDRDAEVENGDASDDDGDSVGKKEKETGKATNIRKVTNTSEVEKTMRQKIQSRQNGRQRKKAK